MDLIYILLEEKPKELLILKGELYKYLVKVRRHNLEDILSFRVKDETNILYYYKVSAIENRSIELQYISSKLEVIESRKSLHIAWCVIDSKSIEKVLPSLSEIGVEKISFIFCKRSQKSFTLDFPRFKRILETSMQQSGRSNYMEFASYKNIESFIHEFPNTRVFDFTTKTLDDYEDIQTVLIGCEGGFSQDEKEFLSSKDVFRLNTPMILRSESAVMAVASKILL